MSRPILDNDDSIATTTTAIFRLEMTLSMNPGGHGDDSCSAILSPNLTSVLGEND